MSGYGDDDDGDWEMATCEACGACEHFHEFRRLADGETRFDKCPACGEIQGGA